MILNFKKYRVNSCSCGYLLYKIIGLEVKVYFFLIFLLCGSKLSAQPKQVSLKLINEVSRAELKKDYSYYGFKSNNNYLIWYEGYTGTLFIYNLKKENLKKISLHKGRGPHEYEQISSLTITNRNIIYLVDNTNIKFIRIDVSGKYLKDILPPSGLRPISIISRGGYQVVMDPFNPSNIFYLKEANSYIPIKFNKSTIIKEFPTIFKKEGYLTILDDKLIHITKYYPYIYVYGLQNKELAKKIEFDESNIKKSRGSTNNQGAKMMYPPSKVDILSKDITSISDLPNEVLILAKGASKNHKYGLNKLFEYDFKKEKFIATHKLDIKVNEITVNDKYLFAYSKDKNKIYKYKIIYNN